MVATTGGVGLGARAARHPCGRGRLDRRLPRDPLRVGRVDGARGDALRSSPSCFGASWPVVASRSAPRSGSSCSISRTSGAASSAGRRIAFEGVLRRSERRPGLEPQRPRGRRLAFDVRAARRRCSRVESRRRRRDSTPAQNRPPWCYPWGVGRLRAASRAAPVWRAECSPVSSSPRSSPTVPNRSARTSWLWIVSKFSWRARTKSSSSSRRPPRARSGPSAGPSPRRTGARGGRARRRRARRGASGARRSASSSSAR